MVSENSNLLVKWSVVLVRVDVFKFDYAFAGCLKAIKGKHTLVAGSDELVFGVGFYDFMVVMVIVSMPVVIMMIVMMVVMVIVVTMASSHVAQLHLSEAIGP